ncbi:MAG: FAD-dependent oxidoreductase [Desulfobacterales bacterium]
MTLPDIPFLISRSHTSTEANITGFWRYVRPEIAQKTAPCSAACPVGEDIARVEKLVHDGFYKRALECILMENPFPAVSGRVCFHPCEGACNRGQFDQAVSIRCIERFLGDEAFAGRLNPAVFRFPPKRKKAAVVGAGPAGLAMAYFSILLGYACTIFESESEPGGLLRWGIPSYRLPGDVPAFEIKRIQGLGVDIRCNSPITENALSELTHAYDAVFVACGHRRPLTLGIVGEENMHDGLAFLSELKKGNIPDVKGSAAVIGGGNTAVDVSRTLVRLGIETTLVYRRREQDMPACSRETASALEEGVRLLTLASPVRLEKTNDECTLYVQRMKIDGKTAEGRARAVPKDAPVEAIHMGHVFSAVGAQAEEPWDRLMAMDDDHIRLSHCRIAVGKTPIIYGGDLADIDKSLAHAVASGKQAAVAMDVILSGNGVDVAEDMRKIQVGGGPSISLEIYIGGERKNRRPRVVAYGDLNPDYFTLQPRVSAHSIPLTFLEPEKAFSELEQPLSEDAVLRESGRCFNCGICNDCGNCRLFCPEMAVTGTGGNRAILLEYCKGCGICVAECPRCAMALREEPE